MQQQRCNQIAQWYQNAPDYVILFSNRWELLWQNRDCPMLRSTKNYRAFFHRPEKPDPPSDNFTITYAGEIYGVQFDRLDAPDEILFLVRICARPYPSVGWENEAWRQETENQVAAVRHQIFGISNAVTALYNMIEEFSDDCPRMLLEDQMQQLNVIQGNCCRLMRPSVYLAEHSKYYQKVEISGQPLFLDRELSNFVESCRKVLGRAIKIQQKSASHLCVFTNRDRLQHCLLCLILHIKRTHSNITSLLLEAESQEGHIVLTVTTSSSGTDDQPNRHSSIEPFYRTPLLSQEELVVRLFCKCYDVTMLYTDSSDHAVYVFRFPECAEQAPLSLHSTQKVLDDDTLSLYQILLSDISSYRFY